MTFMIVHGYCAACGRFIAFNPDRVPSLRVDGVRQPICASCFERWNQIHRLAKGLDPVSLHPDAYEPEEVRTADAVPDRQPLFIDQRGRLFFMFPEHRLSMAEQQSFTYDLVRHPDAGKITGVEMVTNSPLIVGSFHRQQIRSCTPEVS